MGSGGRVEMSRPEGFSAGGLVAAVTAGAGTTGHQAIAPIALRRFGCSWRNVTPTCQSQEKTVRTRLMTPFTEKESSKNRSVTCCPGRHTWGLSSPTPPDEMSSAASSQWPNSAQVTRPENGRRGCLRRSRVDPRSWDSSRNDVAASPVSFNWRFMFISVTGATWNMRGLRTPQHLLSIRIRFIVIYYVGLFPTSMNQLWKINKPSSVAESLTKRYRDSGLPHRPFQLSPGRAEYGDSRLNCTDG